MVQEVGYAVLDRILCQRDGIFKRIHDTAVGGKHGKFTYGHGNQAVQLFLVNEG